MPILAPEIYYVAMWLLRQLVISQLPHPKRVQHTTGIQDQRRIIWPQPFRGRPGHSANIFRLLSVLHQDVIYTGISLALAIPSKAVIDNFGSLWILSCSNLDVSGLMCA